MQDSEEQMHYKSQNVNKIIVSNMDPWHQWWDKRKYNSYVIKWMNEQIKNRGSIPRNACVACET